MNHSLSPVCRALLIEKPVHGWQEARCNHIWRCQHR